MGGASEPDGSRGFGRVHLEAGMPLAGSGSLVLLVADAGSMSIEALALNQHDFTVDAAADLDLRVTLSWIDPPASTLSATQLVHDLDLVLVSPSGVTHTMWNSGEKDSANVNERVIVAAGEVETGTWSAQVSANQLTTSEQSYSLVVNGAIISTGDDYNDSAIDGTDAAANLAVGAALNFCFRLFVFWITCRNSVDCSNSNSNIRYHLRILVTNDPSSDDGQHIERPLIPKAFTGGRRKKRTVCRNECLCVYGYFCFNKAERQRDISRATSS